MIQSDWEALERLLTKLTATEARRLISQLEHSLGEADVDHAHRSQSAAWAQILAELESLPSEGSPDAFSAADHDQLLYGRST